MHIATPTTALSLVTDALAGWSVIRTTPEVLGDDYTVRVVSDGFAAFADECIEGSLECLLDDAELTREHADKLHAEAMELVASLTRCA